MSADKQENLFDMFLNLGRGLNLPQADMDKILENHRKNIQALEKAAKTAGSGANAVMERQREMVADAVREMTDLSRNVTSGAGSADMMARQADFARRSFETAVRNASELGEMSSKSGRDAMQVLADRMNESMEEIRSFYSGKGGSKKS